MKAKEFTPKFFSLLKEGISRKQLTKDVLSGVIVGIVALPLAIAFAIASGVSPEKGLITAIVAGLVISVLSGSRVQIGGPTGAFIIIVYGIVQEHGVDGLIIATFLAGFLIAGLGLLRLGNYLKFIPYPLIVGFTSGIAVVIFSTQIKDFLGLDLATTPVGFLDKWRVYLENIGSVNWVAVGISVGTVIVALNFQRVTTKVPGSLVAIVLSTLLVYYFGLPVETIESKFGEIPNQLSMPYIPVLSFAIVKELIEPAIAIALLGAIESLLSAVVADGMIGGRHRSNMELVAQGVGNIFSGLFGGIPATGAIARTATNIKNGGRTPIAGIIHAVFLLLVMLIFAPVAKLIPLPCLAGILVVVAYHMSEWRHFRDLLKGNRMDTMVLLTTFFLTVFFDLILAIQIGLILSSFIFMKRMSDATTIQNAQNIFGQPEYQADAMFEEELPYIPNDTMLYEINGPLFFGASHKFQEFLTDLKQEPKVLIIRLRHVPFIDATAINRLMELTRQLKASGTAIIISGANPQVKKELDETGLGSIIGEENILENIQQSILRAEELAKE